MTIFGVTIPFHKVHKTRRKDLLAEESNFLEICTNKNVHKLQSTKEASNLAKPYFMNTRLDVHSSIVLLCMIVRIKSPLLTIILKKEEALCINKRFVKKILH